MWTNKGRNIIPFLYGEQVGIRYERNSFVKAECYIIMYILRLSSSQPTKPFRNIREYEALSTEEELHFNFKIRLNLGFHLFFVYFTTAFFPIYIRLSTECKVDV